MDTGPGCGHPEDTTSAAASTTEGATTWPWIIGFVLVVGIIVVVMNRRGSTGPGRDHDQPTSGDHRATDSGYGAPGGGVPGGDGGGGL